MSAYDVVESDFFCQREGLTIRGRQYLPRLQGADPLPAVILSHGFVGNYVSGAEYARAFAAAGYAAFTFNFCGGAPIGESEELISEGRSVDLAPRTQVADLLTVTDYVRGLDAVNNDDLTLVGMSQGGFITALTAAQQPELFARIVLIYPALCIPDHARTGRLGGASYSIDDVPAEIDCGQIVLGFGFHHEAYDMDVYREISGYTGPVLIMHGTDDQVVDHSYAHRAHHTYRPGQSHLQLMRKAGHSFTSDQTESSIASILEFLAGRPEIFSLEVILTGHHERLEGGERIDVLEFVGYIDSPIFRGTTLPGAHHTEVYSGSDHLRTHIEYELTGADANGDFCRLHVVNHRTPEGWRPVITTDNPALAWLRDAGLSAIIEIGSDGPTIRFYASPSFAQTF